MEGAELRKPVFVGLTALLSFVIAAVSFIGPARGYEVSVYDAYPLAVWVAFGIVLVGGLGLILSSAIDAVPVSGWRSGFALIIAAYGVFYALPMARGYVIYGSLLSDALYHLSIVSDILARGHVPELLYPQTHVLLAELAMVAGLPLQSSQMPVSFAFTMLFITGCFVSGRRLLSHRGGIFVLAAAIPLSYTGDQLSILPWFYALAFLPLTVFALQIGTRARAGWVSIPLGVAIVLYHLIISLFAAIALGIYGVWAARRSQRIAQGTVIALIIAIIAPLWGLGTHRVQAMILRAYTGAVGGGVVTYASQAAESGYSLVQLLVSFVILRWGSLFLLLGAASAVAAGAVYHSVVQREFDVGGMLSVQYFVGGAFGVVLAGAHLLAKSPTRVSQFALLFAIYLVGYGLWRVFGRPRPQPSQLRTAFGVGLAAVVLLSALLSAGIAYEENRHVTHATVEGTEWHLRHTDETTPTKSLRMAINIQLYIQGLARGKAAPRVFSRYQSQYQLPTALGYDENSTISTTLTDQSYLITKRSDIAWLKSRSSSATPTHAYSKANRRQLAHDSAAAKLYSNGEFTIWLASG